MRILGSTWATRRAQRITYDQARTANPEATEAELVNIVYEMRKVIHEVSGCDLPPLPRSCTTFDSLVEFIIRDESRYALPDLFGWCAKIDQILAKAG